MSSGMLHSVVMSAVPEVSCDRHVSILQLTSWNVHDPSKRREQPWQPETSQFNEHKILYCRYLRGWEQNGNGENYIIKSFIVCDLTK